MTARRPRAAGAAVARTCARWFPLDAPPSVVLGATPTAAVFVVAAAAPAAFVAVGMGAVMGLEVEVDLEVEVE